MSLIRALQTMPGVLPTVGIYHKDNTVPHPHPMRSQQLTRSRGFMCALKEQSSFEQDRQPPAAGTDKKKKSGWERQLPAKITIVLLLDSMS